MVYGMARVPRNFCGLTGIYGDYQKSLISVLPVPYERTTSYLKGTKFGPKALIDASRYLELYDEELGYVPAEAGISTLRPLNTTGGPDRMLKDVEKNVASILNDGKIPVVLGGEHSISPGVVAAMAKHHGDITVLQLDAHSDIRDSYEGSSYSHACAMARVREYSNTVQVGIRSMGEEEAEIVNQLKSQKRIFFAKDVITRDCIPDIIEGLTDKVYITFDVDALDPSIMPSTGTPEPGGLTWYDSLSILRAVATKRTVVGFDIMELSPQKASRYADFTAAKLTYKIMGYIIGKNRGFINSPQ
jgi:agmatinase